MNAPDSAVVERIRKLLRLARNAGATEAEAASAAEKAQRLLDEHRLSMADLGEGSTSAAPKVGFVTIARPIRHRWESVLLRAVCDTTGTFPVTSKRGFVVFGTREDIVVSGELYAFLGEQVDRMARAATYGERTSVKLGWKLGCAARVAERLRVAFKARVGEQSESRALVIVEPAKRAEQLAMKSVPTKNPRAISRRVVNGAAYAAGHKAGDRVRLGVERKLGDGARKALA